MGARPSRPKSMRERMMDDIKLSWKDPEAWEKKEIEKREREANDFNFLTPDRTGDPPPRGLGRIRESFNKVFKPIELISDTEQAENNRRQNEAGGASLCKGEDCNPPNRTLPVVLPTE